MIEGDKARPTPIRKRKRNKISVRKDDKAQIEDAEEQLSVNDGANEVDAVNSDQQMPSKRRRSEQFVKAYAKESNRLYPDPITIEGVSDRGDVRFQWLLGLHVVKEEDNTLTLMQADGFKVLAGSWYTLPSLYCSGETRAYMQKDSSRKTIWPILLTQQSINILVEVILSTVDENSSDHKLSYGCAYDTSPGIVLSGVHGVGKSQIVYLVACWAYINKLPLLFIPQARGWMDMEDEYIYMNFLKHNKDVDCLDVLYKKVEQVVKTNQMDFMGEFVQYLTKWKSTTPIITIVDEHNEYLKNEGKKPCKAEFFAGAWKGPYEHMFLLLCGSSHTQFINQIRWDPRHANRVKYIEPMTDEEFRVLISSEKSRFYIDLNSISFASILNIIGKLPRRAAEFADKAKKESYKGKELSVLLDDLEKSVNDFYQTSLDKTVRGMSSISFVNYKINLERLFCLNLFKDNSKGENPDPFLLDANLVYERRSLEDNKKFELVFVDQMAADVLKRNYIVSSKVEPIYSRDSPTDMGILFEKAVVHSLLDDSRSVRVLLRPGLKAKEKELYPQRHSFKINNLCRFSLGEMRSFMNFNRNLCTLFKPSNDCFPYIDSVVYIPAIDGSNAKILFLQKTISTFVSHMTRKDSNEIVLFTEKTYRNTNAHKVNITKKAGKGVKVGLCQFILQLILSDDSVDASVTNNKLSYELGNHPVECFHVYLSGSKADEQGVSPIDGIFFMHKSDMEEHFGIVFDVPK